MKSPSAEEQSPEELAYDEYLGAAERGEAPDVDTFLESHGLGHNDALRRRLRIWERVTAKSGGPPEPRKIGPYEIFERLGSGGFGVVYRARQSAPVRREVAIKLIKPGMDTEDVLARFAAEQGALERMEHPGIARVLDAGATESGRPYFVMELVPGQPITRSSDDAHLGMHDRIELFIRVCAAVQHAHQRGTIHRDLKPSNILVRTVDGHPTPKVIDFGVAKALRPGLDDDGSHRTEAGVLVGTVEYMAPEQANPSGPSVPDTRADIYSLGVVLFELLVGSLPLDPRSTARASGTDVGRALMDTPVRAPSRAVQPSAAAARGTTPARHVRALKGELDWIILKAIEKEPGRRYASVSELAADLQRALKGDPVVAGPPSLLYRFRRRVQRHRIASAAILVAILAAATGTILVTLAMFDARTARAAAEREAAESLATTRFLRSMWSFARPTGQSIGEVPATYLLDEASASLDQQLAGQPALRATLRSTLGEINLELERLTEAENEMRAALELAHGAAAAGETDLATLTHNLAVVLADQGKWDEARPLADESMAIRIRVLGPEHIETARSYDLRARALAHAGDLEGAIQHGARALEIAQDEYGQDALDSLPFASNQATWFRMASRLQEAVALQRTVCEVRSRRLGQRSPETLRALSNMAMLHHSLGDHGASGAAFEKIHAAYGELYGADHLATAREANNAATQYVLLGDPARALPLLEESVAVLERKLPESHAQRLSVTTNLSKVLADLGRSAEAVRVATGVIEHCDAHLPDGHVLQGSSRSVLGQALVGLDRFDEACAPLTRAISILGEARGESHPSTLTAMRNLSKACAGLGDHAAAEAWSARADAADAASD